MQALLHSTVTRSTALVLLAVFLPPLCVVAGLLLLRSAEWIRRRAYAFFLVGLVASIAYAWLAADAFRRGGRTLVGAIFLVLAAAWLAFGFLNSRARARASARRE